MFQREGRVSWDFLPEAVSSSTPTSAETCIIFRPNTIDPHLNYLGIWIQYEAKTDLVLRRSRAPQEQPGSWLVGGDCRRTSAGPLWPLPAQISLPKNHNTEYKIVVKKFRWTKILASLAIYLCIAILVGGKMFKKGQKICRIKISSIKVGDEFGENFWL